MYNALPISIQGIKNQRSGSFIKVDIPGIFSAIIAMGATASVCGVSFTSFFGIKAVHLFRQAGKKVDATAEQAGMTSAMLIFCGCQSLINHTKQFFSEYVGE